MIPIFRYWWLPLTPMIPFPARKYHMFTEDMWTKHIYFQETPRILPRSSKLYSESINKYKVNNIYIYIYDSDYMYSKSRNILWSRSPCSTPGKMGRIKKNTPSQLLGGPQNWMDMLWIRIGHPMIRNVLHRWVGRSRDRFGQLSCHGTWRGNSKLCERADLLPFFGLFFLRWLAKPWLRDHTHWSFTGFDDMIHKPHMYIYIYVYTYVPFSLFISSPKWP